MTRSQRHKKIILLAQLNAAAHILALTGLRNQYPQATKAEIRRKLADEIQIDFVLERALKVFLTCS